MRRLPVTFTVKSREIAELCLGEPVKYNGKKIGEITSCYYEVEKKRVTVTATITNMKMIKKIFQNKRETSLEIKGKKK
ncbi:MAG: MlaD family protein [Candidatus Hodarchaeota archaeon]